MTDKARELLERAIGSFDSNGFINNFVLEEIRAFLSTPEQTKFVYLNEDDVTGIEAVAWDVHSAICYTEKRLEEKNR